MNRSKLLDIIDEMKPLITAFHRGITYMSLLAKLTKLGRKENFDTHLDPEWLFARLISGNSKSITLPPLHIKLPITLITAKVSELQMEI